MKAQLNRWASPSTGRARSPPAAPSTTAGTSGYSCACSRGHRLQEDRHRELGPVDQTVLANEQVIDGRGWRTGALVEKREIPMYYLKITAYAEELLARPRPARLAGARRDHAAQLDRPERGRADRLSLRDRRRRCRRTGVLKVFTTRADTIMGVTFCAVAAEHPLAQPPRKDNPQIAAFVEECKRGGMRGGTRDAGEEGHAHRPHGAPSAHRRADPGVGRQLRADGLRQRRGHGRARARRARFRIRQEIRSADQAGDRTWRPATNTPTQLATVVPEHGTLVNSGKYDGLEFAGRSMRSPQI